MALVRTGVDGAGSPGRRKPPRQLGGGLLSQPPFLFCTTPRFNFSLKTLPRIHQLTSAPWGWYTQSMGGQWTKERKEAASRDWHSMRKPPSRVRKIVEPRPREKPPEAKTEPEEPEEILDEPEPEAPKSLYKPPTTEETKRLKIQELAGLAVPIRNIATKAGCREEDLREGGKYYEDVLMGDADANIKVGEAVKKLAVRGVPSMVKMWMECRAGWNQAGSKETIEGKKVRGFEKMTWEVIEGGGQSGGRERSGSTEKRGGKAPRGKGPPPQAVLRSSVVGGDSLHGPPALVIPVPSTDEHGNDLATPNGAVDVTFPATSAVQGGARGPGWREVTGLRADDHSGPRSGPRPEHGVYPGSPEKSPAIGQEAAGVVDPKVRGRRPL